MRRSPSWRYKDAVLPESNIFVGMNISVNVDVFNRRLVRQFSKIALYYDFDLCRYCPTREFYSDLRCLETFL
jgi:hypothetical protein